MFDHTHPEPVIYTSKGNMLESSLTVQAVWSDIEGPIAQAKATMLARIASLEAAMVAGDGPGFHAAMLALKEAANTHVQLTEVTCNLEHWLGGECVRRAVNIKKLVGEQAAGVAQDLR